MNNTFLFNLLLINSVQNKGNDRFSVLNYTLSLGLYFSACSVWRILMGFVVLSAISMTMMMMLMLFGVHLLSQRKHLWWSYDSVAGVWAKPLI
jgi:hypothetical protein